MSNGRKLRSKSKKVNNAIENTEMKNLTYLNHLLKAEDIVIVKRLREKKNLKTTGKAKAIKIHGVKEGWKKVSRNGEKM